MPKVKNFQALWADVSDYFNCPNYRFPDSEEQFVKVISSFKLRSMAFYSTAAFADPELLQEFKGKIALNSRDGAGNTLASGALLGAARRTDQRVDTVDKLVNKHNIDINSQLASGRTLLHVAANLADPQLLSYALSNHADVRLRDNEGQDPIDYLVYDCPETLDGFMRNGATLTLQQIKKLSSMDKPKIRDYLLY